MSDLLEGAGARLDEALADIERVTQIDDGAVRNLWITQRYYELSRDLARTMSGRNANWCTFACWASKTAGRSIRNEEIPRYLLHVLKIEQRFSGAMNAFLRALLGVDTELSLSVVHVVRQTLTEVSLDVANGNLKVFEELAPVFARFVDDIEHSVAFDEQEIEAFEARLRPGETRDGGQGNLRRAFRAFYLAKFAPDEPQRAQWMLLGNCLVGLHEQTRLQPNIRGALNAPIEEIFSDRIASELRGGLLSPVAPLVAEHLTGLLGDVQSAWERTATRYAMNLALPKGTEISLGDDVPEPPGGFPPDLKTLDNSELIDVLRRFDQRLDSLIGSRANNWAELGDRMRFIVDLFRSRQQDQELFDEPFTTPQLAELRRGEFPRGLL